MLDAYRLRLQRRRLQLRARRKARELRLVSGRDAPAPAGGVTVFTVFRNEYLRLPHFLDYYRALGVRHFVMVDNASTDGGGDWAARQPDVTLYATGASYRAARCGMDWMNALLRRHGCGRWCLTVDPDELLVFPFCDSRPLPALADWLDASDLRSFAAMLLDLYPRNPEDVAAYRRGEDPLRILSWFDGGNYVLQRNPGHKNPWIQGGPRARAYFAAEPWCAPALNKVPLVRWSRRSVYVSATHMMLPRGLNQTYDRDGGETACGVLLHTKMLASFTAKAGEERARRQHFAGGREYGAYAAIGLAPLWGSWSERYAGWRQLEGLGLISRGHWA
ncbi:glycosyl transferase family 2 [Pseudoroseicyclus aestuarii]|uniref:Glycosyl transferase family 2 n=1 Tax=Pseudoroseicyclus aestuarii TaxID=1795041 RepID=A0A318SSQ6_9RHOB|nr:glycosyl transferase family 2 [Pseudoroseicyclus aestuarii]